MSDELLPSLPGNVGIIRHESDRLTRLAELHEHGWRVLHALPTDGWSGTAASGFDEIRRAQARSWSRAADCYTDAAKALSRFADELEELQRLADSVIADAEQSGDPLRIEAARQSLRRWSQQLDESGGTVARSLRELAAQLRELGQNWIESTPGLIGKQVWTARSISSDPPRRSGTHRRHSYAPGDYRCPDHERDKTELSDSVFRSWQA